MKPSALLLALLCAGALLLLGPLAQAQRFPRQLENIKMFGRGESVQFIFSQPYEDTPQVAFHKGSFALTFNVTGITKPVRALRPVDESIYKEVKMVQNRYSTTVTFLLKNPALNLKNRIAFTPDKNVLKMAVNRPATPVVASPQGRATEELLHEMQTRIAGESAGAGASTGADDAAGGVVGRMDAAESAGAAKAAASGKLALGGLGGSQFYYSLLTMVIALVIIVAVLYGVLFVYNRFLASRLRRFTGSHAIRQVAAFHIGPRQRIVVLEINNEIIACGVTPNQITYLTHLGGKGPAGRVPGASADGEPADGPGPGGPPAAALVPQAVAPPADPVHQFAEVLKQKVRSLKRIN